MFYNKAKYTHILEKVYFFILKFMGKVQKSVAFFIGKVYYLFNKREN